MHLIILLVVRKCEAMCLLMNLVINQNSYIIKILLWHRHLNNSMICLNIVRYTSSSLASFSSFMLVSIRVDVKLHSTMLNLFNTSNAYFLLWITNPCHVSMKSIPENYSTFQDLSISNSIIICLFNFSYVTISGQ